MCVCECLRTVTVFSQRVPPVQVSDALTRTRTNADASSVCDARHFEWRNKGTCCASSVRRCTQRETSGAHGSGTVLLGLVTSDATAEQESNSRRFQRETGPARLKASHFFHSVSGMLLLRRLKCQPGIHRPQPYLPQPTNCFYYRSVRRALSLLYRPLTRALSEECGVLSR